VIDILIVEDDPTTGHALTALLSRQDYALKVAATLADTRALVGHMPRAVILDLMVPNGDGDPTHGSGEDMIGVILSANPDCRVIVCTGMSLTDGRKDAIRAKGAHEILIKPIDFARLLSVLAKAIPKEGR
jgi:DNA-binding NtrC family response regulator